MIPKIGSAQRTIRLQNHHDVIALNTVKIIPTFRRYLQRYTDSFPEFPTHTAYALISETLSEPHEVVCVFHVELE